MVNYDEKRVKIILCLKKTCDIVVENWIFLYCAYQWHNGILWQNHYGRIEYHGRNLMAKLNISRCSLCVFMAQELTAGKTTALSQRGQPNRRALFMAIIIIIIIISAIIITMIIIMTNIRGGSPTEELFSWPSSSSSSTSSSPSSSSWPTSSMSSFHDHHLFVLFQHVVFFYWLVKIIKASEDENYGWFQSDDGNEPDWSRGHCCFILCFGQMLLKCVFKMIIVTTILVISVKTGKTKALLEKLVEIVAPWKCYKWWWNGFIFTRSRICKICSPPDIIKWIMTLFQHATHKVYTLYIISFVIKYQIGQRMYYFTLVHKSFAMTFTILCGFQCNVCQHFSQCSIVHKWLGKQWSCIVNNLI